ncbi:hypothetical protein D3C78_1281840 [compost metagenome]
MVKTQFFYMSPVHGFPWKTQNNITISNRLFSRFTHTRLTHSGYFCKCLLQLIINDMCIKLKNIIKRHGDILFAYGSATPFFWLSIPELFP